MSLYIHLWLLPQNKLFIFVIYNYDIILLFFFFLSTILCQFRFTSLTIGLTSYKSSIMYIWHILFIFHMRFYLNCITVDLNWLFQYFILFIIWCTNFLFNFDLSESEGSFLYVCLMGMLRSEIDSRWFGCRGLGFVSVLYCVCIFNTKESGWLF